MALPLYANVLPNGRGTRSGLYPTVPECKAELKRSISWINELKNVPDLRCIQIPPQGEAMPTVPVPEGDIPLAGDWVVNDRTALYINIPLPEAGYPLQCDMQNHEGEKDDKKYGMKDATTPESDTSSIKGWVHSPIAPRIFIFCFFPNQSCLRPQTFRAAQQPCPRARRETSSP